MSGKTILIVGIDYWPDVTGVAPYTTQFAEHLAGQGHKVHVITGMPYYPEWNVKQGYRRKLRMSEARNGVTIHRRRQYVPRRQSAIRRAGYEGSFLANSIVAPGVPKPDLVIGVVPGLSDGILAARLARQHRIPFSLWIQDLMGQAAAQSGVQGGAKVARMTGRLEGWVARQAASIAIIAEGFRTHLVEMGVAPERIHRVRNWTHVERSLVSQTEAREVLQLPVDQSICLHAGNMGQKQGLENVVNAARLAADVRSSLSFYLVGDGNRRQELQRDAARLDTVTFMDSVSNDVFPKLLAAADVLLVNQRPSIVDMSLPSKLASYLIADRPIVAAVDTHSETAAFLREFGVGTVVEPDDPGALLEACTRATRVELSPHQLDQYRAALSSLDSDACMARLREVVVDVAG